MTGQEIITQFQFLVDSDRLAADQELILLQKAYDRLLAKRVWNFLLVEDETNTIQSGTKTYSLPDDYLLLDYVKAYDVSENDYRDLTLVSFRDRHDQTGKDDVLFLDTKNQNLKFLESPDSHSGETLVIGYTYQPDQIETDTSPVFNRAYHDILSYEMARLFWYNTQDEKSRAYTDEMAQEYGALLQEMISWDEQQSWAADKTFMPKHDWTQTRKHGV